MSTLCDSVAARRAVEASASASARSRCSAARSRSCAARTTGETCHDGEQRHGGCDPGIAPPGATAAPDLTLRALGLVVGKLPGASEVLVLGGGQIGIGAALPLERPRQSGPPVELGVRVVEGGPALGGHGEVTQDAVSLLVLVEPAA